MNKRRVPRTGCRAGGYASCYTEPIRSLAGPRHPSVTAAPLTSPAWMGGHV